MATSRDATSQSPSRKGTTLSALRHNTSDSNKSGNSSESRLHVEDSSGNAGLRTSMDAAFGRVINRARRRSKDERRDSNGPGNRLSQLVSRSSSRLRTSTDIERPSSIDSTSARPPPSIAGNRSDSSLGRSGSGGSSLLTEDPSDSEEKPTRPSISPHHSHVGYLTLSSPELHTPSQPSLDGNASIVSHKTTPHTQSNSSIPQIVEPAEPEPRFPDSSGPGNSSLPNVTKTWGETQANASAVGSEPQTPPRRTKPRISVSSTPEASPAPTTLVTPPTPTDFNPELSRFPQRNRGGSLSSVESIRRRRAQSGSNPSKLSHSIPPPLTPTVEESKTPGGTLTQPGGSGFFSSFFTAAQKAADQLSNTINVPGSAEGKSSKRQPTTEEQSGEEVIPGSDIHLAADGKDSEDRPSAVETLGKGSLKFEHLGISVGPTSPSMAPLTDTQAANASIFGEEKKKVEEEAAAKAVSEAYEKLPIAAASPSFPRGRPLSLASNDHLTLTGEQSPSQSIAEGDDQRRPRSVRSKISGRRRRHRASSATNGTANTSIGGGLNASTTGLSTFRSNGPEHRLTGFAVASSKRNKDFHQLFRSVPEDDYLIEDYSAALQRDILLHGRLYVSEGHICFSSNILGWVTNLVIGFDEVVSVEKKNTAVIFPNAIVIQTLQARNTFASLVARESTYDLLIGIWKINHPNLKSSINGVTLDDAGNGDKTEVADTESLDDEVASGSDDEVYDEDADADDDSFTDAGLAPSIAASDIGDNALSRKPSAAFTPSGAAPVNGVSLEAGENTAGGAPSASDHPGPAAHEPTQCGDEHYDRPLTDTTIPAPLGKVYSLMFGPASGAFMRKWLIDDQKSRELSLIDDKMGLGNDHKSVTFDYIKPLSGSIGPKQTRCITTNTLTAFDLERAVTVDCSTQTPDVPSGSVFVTKTRYCLMWGPSNSTRLVATCTIEWSGKSWLKSAIDSGANAGQIEYVNAIVAALKAAVSSRAATSKPGAKKGRKRIKKGVLEGDVAAAFTEVASARQQPASNWGPLEPVHQLLSPITSILGPLINSQVVIAVLFALLLYTWVNPPQRGGASVGLPNHSSSQRLAAYEEIWRREESSLWDWLDDRVGLEGIYAPASGQQQEKQKVLAARDMGKKLDQDEKMSERQMDEAIRVTEDRLAALKQAVEKKKRRTGEAGGSR